MIIGGLNELHGFLVGNGLAGMCPEAQNFVACMDILSRMCACDPPQAKTARFNQCRQLYVNFAGRASNWLPTLLTKANDTRMSFYINGQLVSEIRR